MENERLDSFRKALSINLEPKIYGTFAEIGAGQEIARWFFRVGGASGTVAKTMSAYDMKFSDEIYGKTTHFTSRERVVSMLNHEYDLLTQRLGEVRGENTTFFVLADTVSARNFQGTNECHGWLALRFQTQVGGAPNDILLHVNLNDPDNVKQQEALGILGVNLIYGAFFQLNSAGVEYFLASLLDGLSSERLEIDMIQFSGPDLVQIDQRVLGLKLIHLGLSNAVLFKTTGELCLPSEAFHKRPVLIERGLFTQITGTNKKMLDSALKLLQQDLPSKSRATIALFEITLNPLALQHEAGDKEILSRVDTLLEMGLPVMVSKYPEYYRVTTFLRRFTSEPIRFVVGVSSMIKILDQKFYTRLEGGILEALGKLLSAGVKAYVYPMKKDEIIDHLRLSKLDFSQWEFPSAELVKGDSLKNKSVAKHLYNYLLDSGLLVAIDAE